MSEDVGHNPAPEKRKRSNFPAGLRVLVVDDDVVCLKKVATMLQQCSYKVTTATKATEALQRLRKNKDNYDVVITDVRMPEMDGFELLKIIGLEMDIPVIMMSANDETSSVMKGIKHGARDYLVKPVRLSELKNIWQHVMRKIMLDTSKSVLTSDEVMENLPLKKRRDRSAEMEEEETSIPSDGDSSANKKPRFAWPQDLHRKFENVVHQLGADKAVPKKILEKMNEPRLTREIVASHLQKYRSSLKKKQGSTTSLERNNFVGSIRRQRDVPNATSNIVSSYNQGLLSLSRSSYSGYGRTSFRDHLLSKPETSAPSLANQQTSPFSIYHQGLLPQQNILPPQMSEQIRPAVHIPAWLANSHPQPDLKSQAFHSRKKMIDDYLKSSSQVPNIGASQSDPSHFTNFGDHAQPGPISYTGLVAPRHRQGSLSIAGFAPSSCPPPGSFNLGGTPYHVLGYGSSQTFRTCQPDSRSGTVQISLPAKQEYGADIKGKSASFTFEMQPQGVDSSKVNGQITYTHLLTDNLGTGYNSQRNDLSPKEEELLAIVQQFGSNSSPKL